MGVGDGKWTVPTEQSDAIVVGASGIANGARTTDANDTVGVIDNSAGTYQVINLELYVAGISGGTPAVGNVEVWLVPSQDGATYGDGHDGTLDPPATCRVSGSLPLRAVATAQRVPGGDVTIGPFKYKAVCKFNTWASGVVAQNTTLSYRLYSPAVAQS